MSSLTGTSHNAVLEITTDLSTALKVYPYTRNWKDDLIQNSFLRGMYLDFNEPEPGKARLSERDSVAPAVEWYVLFEDSEKQIQSDEFYFYGVAYETKVEKALQRLEKFISDIEKTFNSVNQKDLGKRRRPTMANRRMWSRDRLKAMQEALGLFNKEDKLSLYFLYEDWPSEEKAENTDYVKKFKSKILSDWTNESIADPSYVFERELIDNLSLV